MRLIGPLLLAIVLLAALVRLGWAWTRARGLALRPALTWGMVAILLGLASQWSALGEPLDSGRPAAGHWSYLASVATLSALISVLGARRPGGGAWAILMGMLVVLFLLPWLEGSALAGGGSGLDRLRLDPPWAVFFGLLTIAGVTNYLPTRHGAASAIVGLGLVAELIGLAVPGLAVATRARLWSFVPMMIGSGVLASTAIGPRRQVPGHDFDRLWLWFRDRWGVVWALRVRDRFQKAADASGWPVVLRWDGLASRDGRPLEAVPESAAATLTALLRRFADADRLAGAATDPSSRACPAPSAGP